MTWEGIKGRRARASMDKLVESKSASSLRWQAQAEAVRLRVEKHKELPHQWSRNPEEESLACWIGKQRYVHNNINISAHTAVQRRLLEAIPGWMWNPREEKWASSHVSLGR